nr:transposase [Candidatus Enterovibrio luxaltus]
MVKHVFSMSLKDLQGFINSVVKLAPLPLPYPNYSCIKKVNQNGQCHIQDKDTQNHPALSN